MNRYARDAAIIIVAVILSYWTTYSIHQDYSLLYHSDEWDHFTYSLEILKKENVVNYNPYIGPRLKDPNWEVNYYLFIITLIHLTGLEPLELALITPTIVALIMSLNTFLLIFYLTKRKLHGLLAGIFVLTIKSNVTLLGPWFLVPMAYGLSHIPLILYLFLRVLKGGKYWLLVFGLIFINTALIHAQTTTIFLPIFGLYLVLHPKVLWQNKLKLLPLPIIAVILILYFAPNITKTPEEYNIEYYKTLLYETKESLTLTTDDPTGYEVYYYYPRYLGQITIIFSLIGIYVLLASGKSEQRLLPIAILSLLPFVVQYYLTQTIYLSYYRRMFMYNAELLLMAAGVGLAATYELVVENVDRFINDDLDRLLAKGLAIALVLLFLNMQVQSTFAYKNQIYRIIEEKDISAIQWLKNNTDEDANILALPHISKTITPIGERHIIAITKTRLGTSDKRNQDATEFFQASCNRKQEILKRYKPDYVFHQGGIDCPFLELVHRENRNFIYESTVKRKK
ncbi:hypothetical protein ACFLRC_04540 [Candidatus Altiarchaeota archaeon]